MLTIDRAYFALTGGLERWLYRIARKHAGHQQDGWQFEFRHLHAKSASLSPFKRFAFELRDIARRQPLPGYRLGIRRQPSGRELLVFSGASSTAISEQPVGGLVLSGTAKHVLSGTGPSCYQEPKSPFSLATSKASEPRNLESNLIESNVVVRRRRRRWISGGGGAA